MHLLLWIAVAGAAGAVLRYLAHLGIVAVLGAGFPYGTLVINVLGSFLIGLLFVLLWEKPIGGDVLRLTLMVGLLGSFTTFSAFSLDTWMLLDNGLPLKALANVLANVGTCLAATWAGVVVTRVFL